MASSKKVLAIFLSQGVTSLEAVQLVSAAGAEAKQWTRIEERVLKVMAAFFSDKR